MPEAGLGEGRGPDAGLIRSPGCVSAVPCQGKREKFPHAETERLIRLKEIELAENKAREAKEKSKKLVKLSGLLAIIGVFLIIVGIIAHSFSVEVGIIFLLELAGAWLLLMALCLVLSTLQQ